MIFYYITLACNLRCLHCYAGRLAGTQPDAPFDRVTATLGLCYRRGARQVVFLGGEPTLHAAYGEILAAARDIGYERIVVDTNGTARYPLPGNAPVQPVEVRISFDGLGPAHDRLRGPGTFQAALQCLRRIVADGRDVAVTITLHAQNVSAIADMVAFFARERVREINVHFVSLTGNARAHPWLGLTPELVLRAQERLAELQYAYPALLRYPRLLVKQEELAQARQQGLRCRREHDGVSLILPDGQVYRCPLELTGVPAERPAAERAHEFDGCPLSARLLPRGVPDGYALTCISWKPQEARAICP